MIRGLQYKYMYIYVCTYVTRLLLLYDLFCDCTLSKSHYELVQDCVVHL